MRHMVISLSVALALLAPAASAQSLFDKLQGAIGSVTGQSGGTSSGGGLSQSDVTAGLREALKVGTERVSRLSAPMTVLTPIRPFIFRCRRNFKKSKDC